MKNIYVVYKLNSGAILTDVISIEGKVNHLSITKEIREKMDYYEREWPTILSWQEEEPFTSEEEDEFWKNV